MSTYSLDIIYITHFSAQAKLGAPSKVWVSFSSDFFEESFEESFKESFEVSFEESFEERNEGLSPLACARD